MGNHADQGPAQHEERDEQRPELTSAHRLRRGHAGQRTRIGRGNASVVGHAHERQREQWNDRDHRHDDERGAPTPRRDRPAHERGKDQRDGAEACGEDPERKSARMVEGASDDLRVHHRRRAGPDDADDGVRAEEQPQRPVEQRQRQHEHGEQGDGDDEHDPDPAPIGQHARERQHHGKADRTPEVRLRHLASVPAELLLEGDDQRPDEVGQRGVAERDSQRREYQCG
jgi:hypothetical protein